MKAEAAKHIDHDCNSPLTMHYGNSLDYEVETCGVCDKIIRFRWKSFWKRLKSIF